METERMPSEMKPTQRKNYCALWILEEAGKPSPTEEEIQSIERKLKYLVKKIREQDCH